MTPDTQPRALFGPRDFIAAAVTGILGAMSSISYAALVFSGPLSAHLGTAIALFLVSGIALRVITAARSSYPLFHAGPQAAATAVLALICEGVLHSMPAGNSVEQLLATMVATLALSSVATGIVLLILGYSKGQNLVNFIPYPVIGGFLAGTGWLLMRGSFVVMTGAAFQWSNVHLLDGGFLIRLVPGVVLAIALWFVRKSPWTLPVGLPLAFIVFYAVLWISNTSLSTARAEGLLLGPFPSHLTWTPLSPTLIGNIVWPALLVNSGRVAILVAIVVLSLSLTSGAVETVTGTEVDLTRDFKAGGLANLASGLLSGVPGHPSPTETLLAFQMGAKGPTAAILSTGVFVGVLALGPSFLSLLPRMVMGGLLLFIGLIFLSNWLLDGWKKLSATDYSIVVAILLVVGAFGFLQGVVTGLMIAVVLFAVDYSRVDVSRRVQDGLQARSNRVWPPSQQKVLNQQGQRIVSHELQGYLFFGSATTLRDKLKSHFAGPQPPDYVIMDFRLVSGMDSSSAVTFARMVKICASHEAVMVLTSLSDALRVKMEAEGVPIESKPVREFRDLDHGLEWCELELIRRFGAIVAEQGDIHQQLIGLFGSDDLFPYLERHEFAAGDVLFRKGDPANGMIFLETGMLNVLADSVRLRTFTGGTFLGEMGLYDRVPRSALVHAEEPSVTYLLSNQSFDRINRENPTLASALHRVIIGVLSERLRHTSTAVR